MATHRFCAIKLPDVLVLFHQPCPVSSLQSSYSKSMWLQRWWVSCFGVQTHLDGALGGGKWRLKLVGLLPVFPSFFRYPGQLGPQLSEGFLERRLLSLKFPPQLGLGAFPCQQVVGSQLLSSLHGLQLALIKGLSLGTNRLVCLSLWKNTLIQTD